MNDVVIPAKGEKTVSVVWTPSVAGHYCVQFDYSWQPDNGQAGVAAGGLAQRNLDVVPGPFLNKHDKNAAQRARDSAAALGDGSTAVGLLTDVASQPASFLQGQLLGNILDFIFDAGGGMICGTGGGVNCKGWNGPHLQLPGGSANLLKDPPRQDYDQVAVTSTIAFPPAQPGPDMPGERAAALNQLTAAGLELTEDLAAASITYDRYSGAAEAGDLQWSAVQGSTYVYYLLASGNAAITVADKLDALRQELQAEGYADVIITAADYAAYQDRLRSQGFNQDELQAAHLAGLTDEGIQAVLQARLALDPTTLAGSLFQRWSEAATALRELGESLAAIQPFPRLVVTPGGATGGASALAAAGEPVNMLANVAGVDSDFQVGNPGQQVATITLPRASGRFAVGLGGVGYAADGDLATGCAGHGYRSPLCQCSGHPRNACAGGGGGYKRRPTHRRCGARCVGTRTGGCGAGQHAAYLFAYRQALRFPCRAGHHTRHSCKAAPMPALPFCPSAPFSSAPSPR